MEIIKELRGLVDEKEGSWVVNIKQLLTRENMDLVFCDVWHDSIFESFGLLNELQFLQVLDHCVAIGIQDHITDCSCCSPIHYAVLHGCSPKCIRALLDLGTNPNRKNEHGISVMDMCTRMDLEEYDTYHLQALCVLIDAGAPLSDGLPQSLSDFVVRREASRAASLIVLGLNRCDCDCGGNGRDVLRVISRCVWSTRGYRSNLKK